MTYSLVRRLPEENWQGVAYLAINTENKDYYVVSRAETFDRGDETMIFASDENGKPTSWEDLYVGYGVNHDIALAEFAGNKLSLEA